MAQGVSPLDTAHRGPVHAAQLDHFGKRLATASADHTVRVWEVGGGTRHFVAELKGHAAPVWTVAWAHPMHGPMLASAGEDCHVIIWREADRGEWCKVHSYRALGAVMVVTFSPWEYGLQLALASCDGHVTVLSFQETQDEEVQQPPSEPPSPGQATTLGQGERWLVDSFRAHEGGVFAVCWAPATSPHVDNNEPGAALSERRLVTGGADNDVRLWRYTHLGNPTLGQAHAPTLGETYTWAEEHHFPADEHGDWVRDVAWRPNVGIPSNTIASCAEDGSVVIWTQATCRQPWRKQKAWRLNASAWQVSWSITGSVLAVSTSNNEVWLYKECLDGCWEIVESYNEDALTDSPSA